MAQITGTIRTADGLPLFHRRWSADRARVADAPARPPVILVHGYLEHSGRYDHVGERLAAAGHTVWGADLRGHGQSGGARGAIERWEDYEQDVAALIDAATAEAPGPVVVLGHSNGGLVALGYALRHPDQLSALVLSSPLLALAVPVPWHLRALAPVLSRFLPRSQIAAPLRGEDLTRDPEMIQRHRADPLILRKATPRWFAEHLTAIGRAAEAMTGLRVPLLLLLGSADRVAAPAAARAAFARIPATEKELRWYDGSYHELFNDVNRDEVLGDLVAWLEARLAARPARVQA